MKSKSFFCYLFFIAIIFGCNSNKNLTGVYTSNECDKNIYIADISNIIDSLSSYDGRFVEVSGYYNWGTEESAMSEHKNTNKKERMIWINIDTRIIDRLKERSGSDPNLFAELGKKKFTIKGKVSATNRGHLDQYAATINGICYLRVW